MPLTWNDLSEGMALPRLEKRPGVTQLVKYAAGSGDFNPLHHDYRFPQAKQLGSIIVHGRFKYAALGELSLGELRAAHPRFDEDVREMLSPERMVERRDLEGGPARGRVEAAIAALRARLFERGVDVEAAAREAGLP